MTPTFQSVTIARIMSAAPTLRYIAFYHADEDRLNACMNGYARRSFVYILSADHGGTEYFLYVGKSKVQYARVLQHMKNYAFDHIYLFECAPEELAENERAVIGELKPLFNRNANPLFRQYKTLLGIDYNARQDAEAIHKYLSAYERYNTRGLFGFTLPRPVFTILSRQAAVSGCTCSELLQQLLEQSYAQELAAVLYQETEDASTNLISAECYGDQHGKSKEQIKQHLRRSRLPGALKVGRDWVLPQDTKFPDDLRRKNRRV